MTKQLIIRLPGHAHSQVPWVLWQSGEAQHERGEIVAQGHVEQASQLGELAALSRDAKVTVLVSSAEIGFHQLDLPPGSKRHLAQVVPYALEEDLAQDIQELHFAWQADAWRTPKGGEPAGLPVAVVAKKQLQAWQSWLDDAGISYNALIPDLFILPQAPDEWTAMRIADEVVVRHSAWRGFSIEQTLFAELAGLFSDALTPPQRIRCFGDVQWPQAPAELSTVDQAEHDTAHLLLLARAVTAGQSINLLQGEFAKKRQRKATLGVWRWPAVAAAALVALLFIDKGLYIWQLNQQQAQVRAQIEQRYRDTFPNESRVVNVRAQLNQHLARLQGGGESSQVLALLSQLTPAFAGTELDITLMQFDANRNELRIQATAADFVTFERFRELATEQELAVEQGQLNSRAGRIAGTLVVRGGS